MSTASTYHHQHRVGFAQTDMAGIMHFSEFFKIMENTEHAFLRSLDFSVHPQPGHHQGHDQMPKAGWPRGEAQCRYLAPARFEDLLDIYLKVVEKKNKALVYQFDFWHKDIKVAEGRLVTICVTKDSQGKMKATAIPDAISERIAVHIEPPTETI